MYRYVQEYAMNKIPHSVDVEGKPVPYAVRYERHFRKYYGRCLRIAEAAFRNNEVAFLKYMDQCRHRFITMYGAS